MKKARMSISLVIALLLAVSALPAFAAEKLPNDILWVTQSDAYKCCVAQAYLNAMTRLKSLAAGKKPGSWCVILDADETVISNAPFQADLARSGEDFSAELWNKWCEKSAATALPGAKEFCSLAKKLGGKVIIISNRKEPPLGEATVKNLRAQGIPFDAALLREGPYRDDRSKKLRRMDVTAGSVKTLPAGTTLPPLEILMRVGDQTHDLYDDKELSFDNVKDHFDEDLVIIPNPMYGSWAREKSPARKPRAGKPAAAAAPSGARSSGAIGWKDAMAKVGERVVVEDPVVSAYVPEHGPAKLNFGKPWWESLTVVVFDPEKFGDLKGFEGKTVRVSGTVGTWTDRKGRETVQIKISDPSQIEIVR